MSYIIGAYTVAAVYLCYAYRLGISLLCVAIALF